MRHDSSRSLLRIGEALASLDVEDRRQAASALPQLEAASAVPLLVRALGDDDWRVRKEATHAARSFLGDPTLVEALIVVLGRDTAAAAAGALDNVGLRNAAVDVLAATGPQARPALVAALAWLDADGRKLAVEALGRSCHPDAVEPLAVVLDDADANVRAGAVEALASLGPASPKRVGEILHGALDDSDPVVRLSALHGLTAIGVAVPWQMLAPLLRDPSLRSAALEAAALSDSPEAAGVVVGALVEASGSGFAGVLSAVARIAAGPLRAHVAEALVGAAPRLGVELLALAANDAEPAERRGTALVIAALARAAGALEAAIGALADDVLDGHAREALATLGPSVLTALVVRVADPHESAATRAELVDVVANVALELDPSRVPWTELLSALRVAAEDEDRRLATRALAAIARAGTIDDIELLARAAFSADRARAWASEGALSRLVTRFPDASRQFFDRHASDEAWTLPLATLLGALSAAGRARADDISFLAHAATAGPPAARRAAVFAAAEIGGVVAMEVLSLALADEEPDVQLAAARGLGQLCVSVARGRALPDDVAMTERSARVDAGRRPSGPMAVRPVARARDTIPDAPASSGRAAQILDLVDRSGSPDLVAAAVRAIGDGLAADGGEPSADLLFALASFARHATSPVALAAVDALAHAPDLKATAHALASGLMHADDAVARAAVLQLAARDDGWDSAVLALSHSVPGVRRLAAEALAGRDAARASTELGRRLALETSPDVRAALEAALAAPSRREGR